MTGERPGDPAEPGDISMTDTPASRDPNGPAMVAFLAAGLGDRSHLVAQAGEAVVVDPQRDVGAYLEAAEALGARIRFVLDTHVHNDYASGATELARRASATVVMPAGSDAAIVHRAVSDDDELQAGPLRVRALHTPGHTPEHTSYLVTSVDAPESRALLFSGGSLLAGSAGRTDLLGPAWTERLVADQFSSVRRLASLPGRTLLHPTHGAGSFCTVAAPAGDAVTTIDQERASNPALADADEAAFRARALSGLLRYPAYYVHMAPLNRAGAPPLGAVVNPPVVTADDAAAMQAAGVAVVDGRPRDRFAVGHVPGSLNVELDETFATYVGWLVPWGRPLVLVLDDDQDGREAALQLARIGWDAVRGRLPGVEGWEATGRPLGRFRRAAPADLRAALAGPAADHPVVLDVRQPAEWAEGTIPGSVLRFVADLGNPRAWLPADREVWTICAGGYRAAIAASLLAAEGYRVVAVNDGVADVRAGR
jgi:hydroxyacylglutathione hydrolase